tara:strand:- start:652 stop:1380 length:729 start_codon:yes stop_codon:yes gene_type:complete
LEYVSLLLISFLSNLFSAFSGGGAGIIQLPAILLLFEISFPVALATHKISTVLLGFGATLKFFEKSKPSRKLLNEGIIIGLPAVIIGAYSISFINENLARQFLGLLILLVFFLSLTKSHNQGHTEPNPFIVYVALFIIGFLNGSLSAGTGLLYTLMLTKLYGYTFKEAIGYTLLVVGLFYNLVGAIVLFLMSSIDVSILPILLLGSFAGGYVGAMVAIKKSNVLIRTAYQLVTLIVAYKLLS